jgi:hypothetical protein
MGVVAIGVGNLAGALVEAFILDRATRNTAGVAPHRPMLRPLAVAIVAGTAGWLLCTSGPSGLWIALAAGSLTVAVAAVGLRIVCGEALKDVLGLALGSVSSAVPTLRRKRRPLASGTPLPGDPPQGEPAV